MSTKTGKARKSPKSRTSSKSRTSNKGTKTIVTTETTSTDGTGSAAVDPATRRIGVVAHERKTTGGGLPQLRASLAERGVDDPCWIDVTKSKFAPAAVDKALEQGIDTLLVWGGDGTVQRCLDALVRSGKTSVDLAIVPAGTANLLAHNLELPIGDIDAAVGVALHGARRPIDVGRVKGEHFAVMAGIGFDAMMIKGADRSLKDRVGRAAYLWTGARSISGASTTMTVKVDGIPFFEGEAGCVLCGNVGTLMGGVPAFPDADPGDGVLDFAVVEATTKREWVRVLGRLATGQGDQSPLVHTTTGRKLSVRLEERMPYQLDGGDRPKVDRLKVKIVPRAVTVRVPMFQP